MSELLFGDPLDHFVHRDEILTTEPVSAQWLIFRPYEHISCDSEPGATTCIKRMYLQAVLGRFQNALCMMEAKVSPDNAWEMAPPERKECIEVLPHSCRCCV